MNVEIRTEAAQFPEEEYINGIFIAVQQEKLFIVIDTAESYNFVLR